MAGSPAAIARLHLREGPLVDAFFLAGSWPPGRRAAPRTSISRGNRLPTRVVRVKVSSSISSPFPRVTGLVRSPGIATAQPPTSKVTETELETPNDLDDATPDALAELLTQHLQQPDDDDQPTGMSV